VQQIGAQSRPRATAEPRKEIHSDSPTRQQRSATTRHDAQVLIEGGVEERVEHAVGVAEHRDDVHPGQRPPRLPASTTAAATSSATATPARYHTPATTGVEGAKREFTSQKHNEKRFKTLIKRR